MRSSLLGLCAAAILECARGESSPVFFFTLFPTTSQDYRDELIGRMNNISHWSCTNEPGVKKYALVIPRGDDDGATAYSIEQYDDDDTFNNHLAAKVVQDGLFSWSTSIPDLWASNPQVQNFTSMSEDMSFALPGFLEVEDPYIVVEKIQFSVGADSFRMKALNVLWRDEVSVAKDDGALVFGMYGDPEDVTRFWTLGVYEDENSYKAHLSSKGGQQIYNRLDEFGGKIEAVLLQKKGGFLYKDKTTCG